MLNAPLPEKPTSEIKLKMLAPRLLHDPTSVNNVVLSCERGASSIELLSQFKTI